MELVYKGKMAGVSVGSYKLVRDVVVHVDDEYLAEMLLGIAGMDLASEEEIKAANELREASADEEDTLNGEDTTTEEEE